MHVGELLVDEVCSKCWTGKTFGGPHNAVEIITCKFPTP